MHCIEHTLPPYSQPVRAKGRNRSPPPPPTPQVTTPLVASPAMEAIEYALSDTPRGTDLASARNVGPWLAGFAARPRFAGDAVRGYSEAVRTFHVKFRSECTARGIPVPDAAVHDGRCVWQASPYWPGLCGSTGVPPCATLATPRGSCI